MIDYVLSKEACRIFVIITLTHTLQVGLGLKFTIFTKNMVQICKSTNLILIRLVDHYGIGWYPETVVLRYPYWYPEIMVPWINCSRMAYPILILLIGKNTRQVAQ